MPEIAGLDHPSVVTYLDVLGARVPVGERVAILGAGGIGFDVAEYLTDTGSDSSRDVGAFLPGGRRRDAGQPWWPHAAGPRALPRQVTLLQRKATKVGAGLGKTTGWIHRTELKNRGCASSRA